MLLARSPSRLWPEFWITSCMQHCKYDDALGFDSVEDSVREARYEGAAHLAVDARKYFWIALDGIER